MFKTIQETMGDTWQAFERNVCRFLVLQNYRNVRLVGQSHDHGADVIANAPTGKRCVVQCKHWKRSVGRFDIDKTLQALRQYEADLPFVVSLNGFDQEALARKQQLLKLEHPTFLQLWDSRRMVEMAKTLPEFYVDPKFRLRDYQEAACQRVVDSFMHSENRKALVVLATGLGKTVVAAESIRRIRKARPGLRVLVMAHANPLVEQLERSFWKFISKNDSTLIWNSNEPHTMDQLAAAEFTFACVDSVFGAIQKGEALPRYDIILVDECHHVGSDTYNRVLTELGAGRAGGSFLIGLTATPWRADDDGGNSPYEWFGDPLVCVDMVEGLRRGFLANVDYRMFTSDINWAAFADSRNQAHPFSVKQLNKTIFVREWNDAIIDRFKEAYEEVRANSREVRAIIFCATIEHAKLLESKINSLKFCVARALYSGGGRSEGQTGFDRNRILADFSDGRINVVCAVDIFNEGLDVPDVNLIVFNRTTHSRRIFIQQLGRGLRIAEDKSKVVVLDFVSDIRRIAEGISLKKSLSATPRLVSINHSVTFHREGGEEDPSHEAFLRGWLEDILNVKDANDEWRLRFPPITPN